MSAALPRPAPTPFLVIVLVTALPMFMATLDNLVVTNALPVIRNELGASLETLQWIVNAYTLAFATLLLTASAWGDRVGRRAVFVGGVALFTAASAAAALSPDTATLVAARAVQGAAGAAVMPLSLTLLAAAVPRQRRALAVGVWGGVSGLGVALGPLVGGAIVDGLAWQWIFWVNVPIGLVAIPLALRLLPESRGPHRALDPLGLLLSGAGVLALVWAVVRAETLGWTARPTVVAAVGGVALLVAFVGWQTRAPEPLVPLRLFRSRGFAAANGASLAFSFGMFGSVFLLAQFFQVVQGLSPLEAGLRTMPWTMAPMVVAPLAGLLERWVGVRALVTTGLLLQSTALLWLAVVIRPDLAYTAMVAPYLLAGVGMGLTFAPVATAVLASVADPDHGIASGVNSTVREIGIALGVAVLTAVFAATGDYTSGPAFVDGLASAVALGATVVAAGVLAAVALPGRARSTSATTLDAPPSVDHGGVVVPRPAVQAHAQV